MDSNSIILIITFVASVLQIILFFKIWAMTDDVRILRKKMHPGDVSFEIKKMIALGGSKEDIKKILLDRFFDKIQSCAGNFEHAKNELKSDLNKINEDMPIEIEKMSSVEDFNALF